MGLCGLDRLDETALFREPHFYLIPLEELVVEPRYLKASQGCVLRPRVNHAWRL